MFTLKSAEVDSEAAARIICVWMKDDSPLGSVCLLSNNPITSLHSPEPGVKTSNSLDCCKIK
jgi:hypothetical protein